MFYLARSKQGINLVLGGRILFDRQTNASDHDIYHLTLVVPADWLISLKKINDVSFALK